jgi:hypothetical protein
MINTLHSRGTEDQVNIGEGGNSKTNSSGIVLKASTKKGRGARQQQLQAISENQANEMVQRSSGRKGNFWVDCPRCCMRIMYYFSCNGCYSKGQRRNRDLNSNELVWYDDDYSSGDSDSEYVHMFAYLPTEQKAKRLLHLWSRLYIKLKAALLLIDKMDDLR